MNARPNQRPPARGWLGRSLVVYALGSFAVGAVTAAVAIASLAAVGLGASLGGLAESWLVFLGAYLLLGAVLGGVALFHRQSWAPTSDPRAQPTSVAIALTAYNEERAVSEVVREFLNSPGVTVVIVVDNASTDATARLAAEAGARVVREERRGYGFACQRALQEGVASGADAVVLAEADRTFSGADVAKLTAYLPEVDMALGTRTARELLDDSSQLDTWYTWANMLVAKMLQLRYWESKCWGRVRLTDVGCTMRALRRDAAERIVGHLSVGDDTFAPHMVMVALERGLSVVEVPVTFHKRVGASKGAGRHHLRGLQAGIRMLWDIITFELPTEPAHQRERASEGAAPKRRVTR